MSLLSSNYSEEFINSYLKELNIETINIMIPAIVFLVGIAVLGAVGNSLVLILYWRKRTSRPNRIFILTLSSFDLLTNVFVVPEDIYDMFDYWTFNRPALCRARHYLYTCNTIASSLALLAICVTRYRKICRPFGRQVTVTHAVVACIVLTFLSLLFSVPTAIMNGVKTSKTPHEGIYGYQCGYQDVYLKTKWPMINAAFFILLFILVCTPLVVLYILIGVKARHHKSFRISSVASRSYSMTSSSEVRETVSKLTEEVNNESVCAEDAKAEISVATSSLDTYKTTDVHDEVFTYTRPKQDETTMSSDKYAENSSFRIQSAPNKKNNKEQNSYRMRKKSSILNRGRSESQVSTISVRKSNRTTVMLASITIVFILSFLPFLAVLFYKFAAPESFNRLSPEVESLCHLLLRSYLLNTAANPVIYNLCDVNFRRECFKLLKFW
ncbi:cholecystokinin receptor-like [Physella acuta]|uniref:cholecystokinin receptor-like n=1 Tax=Physella acuta TaxID=109671 RepID=UPI0027DCFCC4|nr:cholecystokinin receptor-like [Physella acuta]